MLQMVDAGGRERLARQSVHVDKGLYSLEGIHPVAKANTQEMQVLCVNDVFQLYPLTSSQQSSELRKFPRARATCE